MGGPSPDPPCAPQCFTDELFDAIRAARIESVRLAFSADEAGEIAVTQAAARLHTIGIECHRIRLLMHVDTLDLYRDGERRRFIDRAAEETGLTRDLLKRDLGKLLLALEQTQDARFNAPRERPPMPALSPADQAEALELLRAPDLLARIASAYDQAGIVGEQSNLLAAYLACASRKLDKPLASWVSPLETTPPTPSRAAATSRMD